MHLNPVALVLIEVPIVIGLCRIMGLGCRSIEQPKAIELDLV